MKARTSAVLASGALVAGLLSAAANGAVVSQCGPTICYDYDDEQSALELFGTPTLVGDTMRFLPATFRAAATGDETAAITAGTFIFDRVYTTGGQDLHNITVRELGDYRVEGNGTVGADLFLLAASNDTPDFVTGQNSVQEPGNSNGLQVWELTASLNDGDVLFNEVALSIQNTLTAMLGDDDSLAWIQKKIVTVDVSAVPLPATAWLLIPGIAWLGRRAMLRRRSSS